MWVSLVFQVEEEVSPEDEPAVLVAGISGPLLQQDAFPVRSLCSVPTEETEHRLVQFHGSPIWEETLGAGERRGGPSGYPRDPSCPQCPLLAPVGSFWAQPWPTGIQTEYPQEVEVLYPEHWDLLPLPNPSSAPWDRLQNLGRGCWAGVLFVGGGTGIHYCPFPGLPEMRAQGTYGLGTGHRCHCHLSYYGSSHLRNQEIAQGVGVG